MSNETESKKNLLTPASSIQPEEMHWLWPGVLVRRAVNIFAGKPGAGKTTLALNLASVVSTGGTFPDGTKCEVGNVAIWSTEDDAASVLRPKLDAAGADIQRVFFLGVEGAKSFDPNRDKDELINEIKQIGGVRLIIIDPILSRLRGNSNQNHDVRAALDQLRDIAISSDAAILGIAHLRKSSSGASALERICGAGAFAQVPRCASLCVSQPAETGNRARGLLVRVKANYGLPAGAIEFSIVQPDAGMYAFSGATKIHWGNEVKGSPEALIASIEGCGDPETDSVISEAASFLSELLRDGPMKSIDVFTAGGAEGFSKAALNRAKMKLGIKPRRSSTEWVWSLKA